MNSFSIRVYYLYLIIFIILILSFHLNNYFCESLETFINVEHNELIINNNNKNQISSFENISGESIKKIINENNNGETIKSNKENSIQHTIIHNEKHIVDSDKTLNQLEYIKIDESNKNYKAENLIFNEHHFIDNHYNYKNNINFDVCMHHENIFTLNKEHLSNDNFNNIVSFKTIDNINKNNLQIDNNPIYSSKGKSSFNSIFKNSEYLISNNQKSSLNNIENYLNQNTLKSSTLVVKFNIEDNNKFFDNESNIKLLNSNHKSNLMPIGYNIQQFVEFEPSTIVFEDIPTCFVSQTEVKIINKMINDSLEIVSIHSSSEHIIPILNTKHKSFSNNDFETFTLVFQPTEIIDIYTQIIINTTKGSSFYYVRGKSIPNQYQLSPVITHVAQNNTEIKKEIYIFNHHNDILNILSIYSSSNNILALSPNCQNKECNSNKDLFSAISIPSQSKHLITILKLTKKEFSEYNDILIIKTNKGFIILKTKFILTDRNIMSTANFNFGRFHSINQTKSIDIKIMNSLNIPIDANITLNNELKEMKLHLENNILSPNSITKCGVLTFTSETLGIFQGSLQLDIHSKQKVSSFQISYDALVTNENIEKIMGSSIFYLKNPSQLESFFIYKNNNQYPVEFLNVNIKNFNYSTIENFKRSIIRPMESGIIFFLRINPDLKLKSEFQKFDLFIDTNLTTIYEEIKIYHTRFEYCIINIEINQTYCDMSKSFNNSGYIGLIEYGGIHEIEIRVSELGSTWSTIHGIQVLLANGCNNRIIPIKTQIIYYEDKTISTIRAQILAEKICAQKNYILIKISEFELYIPIKFQVTKSFIISKDPIVIKEDMHNSTPVYLSYDSPFNISIISYSLKNDKSFSFNLSTLELQPTLKSKLLKIGFLKYNQSATDFLFKLVKSNSKSDLNISSPIVTPDEINAYFQRKSLFNINETSQLIITTNFKQLVFNISASISFPRLVNSKSLYIGTSPIGGIIFKNITIKNPTSEKLQVNLFLGDDKLLATLRKDNVVDKKYSNFNNFFVEYNNHPSNFEINPNSFDDSTKITLSCNKLGEYFSILYLRNNFTIFDYIELHGYCNENLLSILQEEKLTNSLTLNNPTLNKYEKENGIEIENILYSFKLKNLGQEDIIILGTNIDSIEKIDIQPNLNSIILLKPDEEKSIFLNYKKSHSKLPRELIVTTNLGNFKFPIILNSNEKPKISFGRYHYFAIGGVFIFVLSIAIGYFYYILKKRYSKMDSRINIDNRKKTKKLKDHKNIKIDVQTKKIDEPISVDTSIELNKSFNTKEELYSHDPLLNAQSEELSHETSLEPVLPSKVEEYYSESTHPKLGNEIKFKNLELENNDKIMKQNQKRNTITSEKKLRKKRIKHTEEMKRNRSHSQDSSHGDNYQYNEKYRRKSFGYSVEKKKNDHSIKNSKYVETYSTNTKKSSSIQYNPLNNSNYIQFFSERNSNFNQNPIQNTQQNQSNRNYIYSPFQSNVFDVINNDSNNNSQSLFSKKHFNWNENYGNNNENQRNETNKIREIKPFKNIFVETDPIDFFASDTESRTPIDTPVKKLI